MADKKKGRSIQWDRPRTRGEVPCARSGHSLSMIGNSGYLFGGVCAADEALRARPLDEMHMVELNKTEARWTQLHFAAAIPIPLARWRHSACIANETQIIIFGGYHTANLRLNDVWIFDSITNEWTQPYLPQVPGFISEDNDFHEASGRHPPSHNYGEALPSPRGGHTATVLGRSMFVFGGYGGLGYGRRDLDDLYALDLDQWTWTRIEPKGDLPPARSGHQACAVQHQLFLFGGWSLDAQYSDLYLLDLSSFLQQNNDDDASLITTNTDGRPPEEDDISTIVQNTNTCRTLRPVWTRLRHCDLPLGPCWNSTSCAVAAVPYDKIFTFGGARGPLNETNNRLGDPCGHISVIDTGTFKWTRPDVTFDKTNMSGPPKARSDTVLSFDTKSSKLVIFGGWGHEWYGDLYTLDIAMVVGPPYHVTDLHPSIGPVTGGTEISIVGIDFTATPNTTIRFSSINSNHNVDVPGTYVRNTQLRCITPDFKRKLSGGGEVQVRVAQDEDSFTSTFRLFKYFSVTDASHSLIFGPGLLSGGPCEEETVFYIRARDCQNQNRSTGDDEFRIIITQLFHDTDDGEFEEDIPRRLIDNEDGTYEVFYVPPAPGEYRVDVEFMGTNAGKAGSVRGSGAIATFVEYAPRSHNSLGGKLVKNALSKDMKHLESFLKEVGTGMRATPYDPSYSDLQNRNALIYVKEQLHAVIDQQKHITFIIDRVDETLSSMKENGVAIGPLMDILNIHKENWLDIQAAAPRISIRLDPLFKEQNDRTRDDIREFQSLAQNFLDQTREAPYASFGTGVSRATELINLAFETFDEINSQCKSIIKLSQLFDCADAARGSVSIVQMTESTLIAYRQLWECVKESEGYIEQAGDLPWNDIDAGGLEENAKQILDKIHDQDRLIKRSNVYIELERVAINFYDNCPIVANLKQSTIQSRHWDELREIAGAPINKPFIDQDTQLRDFLALELHKCSDNVAQVIERAAREARQESTLKNVTTVWDLTTFDKKHDKLVDMSLLELKKRDKDQLGSDMLALQSILSGRLDFAKPQATEWLGYLTIIDSIVHFLDESQRVWLRLSSIFDADKIKDLPDEMNRFAHLDTSMRTLLKALSEANGVLRACQRKGLTEEIQNITMALELSKKDMSLLVARKCNIFSRFYFLSESTLIRFLADGSSPADVVSLFPLISMSTGSVILEEDPPMDERPRALRFTSAYTQEEITFDRPPRLDGKVEIYLQTFLNAQVSILQRRLKESLKRYPTQARTKWLQHTDRNSCMVDPAQIVLLVAAIDFTRNVEDAMRAMGRGNADALVDYAERHKGDLHDLIGMTLTPLTPNERIRLENLILYDAHGDEILTRLLENRVVLPTDFIWQSQTRVHVLARSESHEATSVPTSVLLSDSEFRYEFEYLGSRPRIVVTALTERFYLSTAKAIQLHRGCAVSGASGCGKSETTKSLALALGKPCYTFNCASRLEVATLTNIFKGLATSGSWLVFDQFDRLALNALSFCMQHFRTIFRGLARMDGDSIQIDLDGEVTVLKASSMAFVTLNLENRIANGLPHGLDVLFRPFALSRPDVMHICEIELMSKGFSDCKSLASKIYCFFSAMQSGLIEKRHLYDWNMHSLRAVLVAAGRAKHAEPQVTDELLVLQALRDCQQTRILKGDEQTFLSTLYDIFSPAVLTSCPAHERVAQQVMTTIEEMSLWPEESFRFNVTRLHELLSFRQAAILLGAAGIGKTTMWKVLKNTCEILTGAKIRLSIIPPKVFSAHHFFGTIDQDTKEWKDGLLSSILRDHHTCNDDSPAWLVFDGEIDIGWVEALQGLLDEHWHALTLPSCEHLTLQYSHRILFETTSLRNAGPGIVGRASVLYVSDVDGHQWRSPVAAWLQSQPDNVYSDENRNHIGNLVEKYIAPTLDFLRKGVRPLAPSGDVRLVLGFLRMLEISLSPKILSKSERLETMFMFCCIWAFGSALSTSQGKDHRRIFSDWWRDEFKSPVRIPAKDTIFDYWLDPKSNTFEPWRQIQGPIISEFDSAKFRLDQFMVPTSETTSILFWGQHLLQHDQSISIIGESFTGKTLLAKKLIGGLNSIKFDSLRIKLNFHSTSLDLIDIISTRLHRSAATSLEPHDAKRFLCWVDDVHLPCPDKFGSQSPVALMRQHIEHGFWHDVKTKAVTTVSNCQYVTCATAISGYVRIESRFQSRFSTFALGSASSLSIIFRAILDGHFRKQPFAASVSDTIPSLLKAILTLDKEVCAAFQPTGQRFHYDFGRRHLVDVCRGLLLSKPLSNNFDIPDSIVRLWGHESCRVYADGMVSDADVDLFRHILLRVAKKVFPTLLTTDLLRGVGSIDEGVIPLIYCHFRDSESLETPLYRRVEKIPCLRGAIQRGLDAYNLQYSKIDVYLFDDALVNIARLARTLSLPTGHLFLAGSGGVGKRTLLYLAAFLCGYTIRDMSSSRSGSFAESKIILKEAFAHAGVKEQGILLFVQNELIRDERILVHLSEIMASDCIGDMYTPEEREALTVLLRAQGKTTGADFQRCWHVFLDNVKNYFHIAYNCDGFDTNLRARLSKFPDVLNWSTVNIFQPWRKSAFEFVAEKKVASLEFENPALAEAVCNFIPQAHQMAVEASIHSTFSIHVSVTAFMQMIDIFTASISNLRKDRRDSATRLENSIRKVDDSVQSMMSIEHDVKIWRRDSENKRHIAEAAAEKVKTDMLAVEKQSQIKQQKLDNVNKAEQELQRRSDDAEIEMAKAAPAIDGLTSALEMLESDELARCRNMATPPKGLADVFGALCVLLAGINSEIKVQRNGKVCETDRTWESVKKTLLSNINGFIADLVNFKGLINEGSVPRINFQEVRPFLHLDTFDEDAMLAKSSAAASLIHWIVNTISYFDKWLEVEPKRKLVVQATKRLKKATSELEEAAQILKKMQEDLERVQKESTEARDAWEAAMEKVRRGQLKLELGQRFVDTIELEAKRWRKELERLSEDDRNLVGDSLLLSAFISYCGPLDNMRRNELVRDRWLNSLESAFANGDGIASRANEMYNCTIVEIGTSVKEVCSWYLQGLCRNPSCCENALILTRTSRWPLLIDPHLQGLAWLKGKFSGANILRPSSQKSQPPYLDLLDPIATEMTAGSCLIIEDIAERFDGALMPLLQQSITVKGGKEYLAIGEHDIEFNRDFRLVLQTRLTRPCFSAEVQSALTLINFTVTKGGLEEQLRDYTFQLEDRFAAGRRNDLLYRTWVQQVDIATLEEIILTKLDVDIDEPTEDKPFIEWLEETTKRITSTHEAMEESEKILASIDTSCEHHRAVARRGTLLFSFLNNLCFIHDGYTFSLNSFIVMFQYAIEVVLEEERKDKIIAAADCAGQSSTLTTPDSIQNKKLYIKRFKWNENVICQALQPKQNDHTQHERADKMSLNALELAFRSQSMVRSITQVIFRYVDTGTFAVDRLTVATILALSLAEENEIVTEIQIHHLCKKWGSARGTFDSTAPEWLAEKAWCELKALEAAAVDDESLAPFREMTAHMLAEAAEWQEWLSMRDVENLSFPGELSRIEGIMKLLVMRILRPDRLPAALQALILHQLGEDLIEATNYDIRSIFVRQAPPSMPLLFVLGAGIDPLSWVEALHAEFSEKELCETILCEGQENCALAVLEIAIKDGNWFFLQNIHTVPEFIPRLERKLEAACSSTNVGFRCFLSITSSLSGLLTDSISKNCFRCVSEATPIFQRTLTRAWQEIPMQALEANTYTREATRCLLALCVYHALVTGRKQFDHRGWCELPAFGMHDFDASYKLVLNVVHKATKEPEEPFASISWSEIHSTLNMVYRDQIFNEWDQRTVQEYASRVFTASILDESVTLAPGLIASDLTFDYRLLGVAVKTLAPPDTPELYSLDPSANSDAAAAHGLRVINLVALSRQFCDDTARSTTREGRALHMLTKFEGRSPRQFKMSSVREKAQRLLESVSAPFIIVAIQECERLNLVTSTVLHSLHQLQLCLNGQLRVTYDLEQLTIALAENTIPKAWSRVAWPSRKSALSWFVDLEARVEQITAWEERFEVPLPLWFALSAPIAFLNAVKVTGSRKDCIPFDDTLIETHVMSQIHATDAYERPDRGALIRGLYCAGASWGNTADEEYIEDKVLCAGSLIESTNSFSPMPVIYIKAGRAPSLGRYLCPVYITRLRNNYIFTASLLSSEKTPLSTWILRGVALFLEDD